MFKSSLLFIVSILFVHLIKAQTTLYYKEPLWKPRGILPYKDAIDNNFWPKSPKVNVHYNDSLFDSNLLSEVPQPGIYPRVLITPNEVEKIRVKLAMGENAPLAFKVMWERVKKSQSPFYALVTKNDILGRQLAVDLVQKIKALLPKIVEMDKRPERDNLWVTERSIVALGDPDPPAEIWDLLNYDYLHNWMTPEECELARSAIEKVTKNRISNFLAYPDHFMINNHQGFGMEYIRLMLLIEGQKGFDKKLFDAACKKVNAMLDWYLDDDGMCYESIKGWLNISAFVAVGLRQRELLKHSHLMAKMHFFQAAIRWEDGSWKIRDEMRASAFHVIWMMHYYHPKDLGIDFLYQSTFSTHPFLTDPEVKWPDPVGISNELLLLYADDGIVNNNHEKIDWTIQANINQLHLPTTWQDSLRGYVDVRNSWNKEDLHVGFVCKQDFFYGGHEGSENNRITLWKDGVNWIQDNNMLATKATFLQNMLTVDGMGCHWPPAPGNWLGIQESKDGVVAAGDGKIGYSFTKNMQVHPLQFPSAQIPYYTPFTEGNFDLSRDLQIAFQPSTIKFNDHYAHTDYGPWSGETRLVENYKPFNPMEQAYRTVQVVKGTYPYVLVIDDAKKDDQLHQFDWNISVPLDVDLLDVLTPEVVFQNTEPSPNRIDDLILGKASTPKDPKTGKYIFKKGDPLCLIRVLWRNTEYGFSVPKFEKFQGYNLVTIPARAVSPEFRVLVYPYKYGSPLPTTEWNADRTELSVQIKDQKDAYFFNQTDGGRTVFAMKRAGNTVLISNAKPSKPSIIVRNNVYNQNDYRYTREEATIPTYLVKDSLALKVVRPKSPAVIRYTLDGSEPTVQSSIYLNTIQINKSCVFKCRTFDPSWEAGTKESDVLTAQFVKQAPAKAITNQPINAKNGLSVDVYEINTKLYNDSGFFDASKIMMPAFAAYKPTKSIEIKNFSLPLVTPEHPMVEQSKGFYKFEGMFNAPKDGVYTFDINSCGPVSLHIGNQNAIASIGVFHQQLKHRSGEVVLSKGWHNLTLIICDPLFWNVNSLEPMPFEVTYKIDEGKMQPINNDQLMHSYRSDLKQPNDQLVELEALTKYPSFEQGFDLHIFDRTGLRREKNFLDIENESPIFSERVSFMETTSSRNTIRVYNAYYFAPYTGEYQFILPTRNGDNTVLGSTQASCQNQLKIDDSCIAQKGVYGRNLSGKVHLKAGWHRFSLRFGTGEATCKVLFNDGQTISLNGTNLFRPINIDVIPAGVKLNKTIYEFYAPIDVALDLKSEKGAEIRYTTDGSIPNQHSNLYQGSFAVDHSLNLKTAAFKNGELLTGVTHHQFKLVKLPEVGSMGSIDFNKWDGISRKYNTESDFKVWVSPLATLTKENNKQILLVRADQAYNPIVDVNVAKGGGVKPGFRLYDIKMRENALTVALWFKTIEKTGKIFGKDGYNAFGKSYKTLSCSINNGVIQANPNKLTGGLITNNGWQYLVLSADEHEMALYLNGNLIASGLGTKEITTDVLDFFSTSAAAVDNVQLYNRLLDKKEVSRLYESQKNQHQ